MAKFLNNWTDIRHVGLKRTTRMQNKPKLLIHNDGQSPRWLLCHLTVPWVMNHYVIMIYELSRLFLQVKTQTGLFPVVGLKATKYVDFNTQKIKWMLGFCGPRIRITTIVRPYSPCFWVIFRFKIQISALIVSPADNAQRIWNWHGSSLARQDKRYEGIKCKLFLIFSHVC